MSKKDSIFHVDFADLEVELRKSIAEDQVSERLGMYITRIVSSILSSKSHVKLYDKERLDLLEFTAYEYIITRILKNYDVTQRSGFGFIKSMALNAIKHAKRGIHREGLNPEAVVHKFDHVLRRKIHYSFLTLTGV